MFTSVVVVVVRLLIQYLPAYVRCIMLDTEFKESYRENISVEKFVAGLDFLIAVNIPR